MVEHSLGFNRIVNHVYAIIFAPKSIETELEHSTPLAVLVNTQSTVDGNANTNAMNTAEHPAAHYCKNLVVDGIADWHLPSNNELELCYRNFKPNAHENYVYEQGTMSASLHLAN